MHIQKFIFEFNISYLLYDCIVMSWTLIERNLSKKASTVYTQNNYDSKVSSH